MTDARDHPIDVYAEILATPQARRGARLAKLAKPLLVQLVDRFVQDLEEERRRCEREVGKRQRLTARLEALLDKEG